MKLMEIKNTADVSSKITTMGDKLLQHCRPFLEQIDYAVADHCVFRGLRKQHYRPLMLKQSRMANRQTVDTPNALHELSNNYFTSKFGHPFRNGVFGIGSFNTAAGYGTGLIYPASNPEGLNAVIFPVGKFAFCWSPAVKDFYSDIIEPTMDLIYSTKVKTVCPDINGTSGNFNDVMSSPCVQNIVKDNLADSIDNAHYSTTDLKQAIDSHNEIMFAVHQYYVLPLQPEASDTPWGHIRYKHVKGPNSTALLTNLQSYIQQHK